MCIKMLVSIMIKLTNNVICDVISNFGLWLRFKSNKIKIDVQFIKLNNVFVNLQTLSSIRSILKIEISYLIYLI